MVKILIKTNTFHVITNICKVAIYIHRNNLLGKTRSYRSFPLNFHFMSYSTCLTFRLFLMRMADAPYIDLTGADCK